MEIGLILVVALLVIGPKKLPELAGQIARTVRELQRTATEFSRELTTPVNEIRRDIYKPVENLKREVSDSITKAPPDPYEGLASETEDEESCDATYENIEAEEQAFIVEDANHEPDDITEDRTHDETEMLEDSIPLPVVRPAPQAVAYQANDEAAEAGDTPPHSAITPPVDASEKKDAEDMA